MLTLAKNRLVTDVAVEQVEVRLMEIEWFCSTYDQMTGRGTMVAGFALLMLGRESSVGPIASTFQCLCNFALGIELAVIMVSAFLSVWAPSLALRGREGSSDMHKAVDCLRDYQKWIFFFFITGWVAVFVAATIEVWIAQNPQPALVATIPMLLFIVALLWFAYDIHHNLCLDDAQEVVAGKIEQLHMYEQIPDLDHGLTSDQPQATSLHTRSIQSRQTAGIVDTCGGLFTD